MSRNEHKQKALTLLFLAGSILVGHDAEANSLTSLQSGNKTNVISDNFQSGKIDPQEWYLKQAKLTKCEIKAKQARSGDKVVAISVDPMMRGCGKSCQRNEIRTSPRYRIKFGQDAIYSFSFRLKGKPSTSRWVSGQWKQQSNGSPFLAQRFDRGEFYVTVQDKDCRVTVASSTRSSETLPQTRLTAGLTSRIAPIAGAPTTCKTDIQVEHAENARLPNPYRDWVHMSYRLRGGLNGKGLVEIWANGRFIARVTGSIGDDRVAGPAQYFKFGIYREFTPGISTAYFDNFRRIVLPPTREKLARKQSD